MRHLEGQHQGTRDVRRNPLIVDNVDVELEVRDARGVREVVGECQRAPATVERVGGIEHQRAVGIDDGGREVPR